MKLEERYTFETSSYAQHLKRVPVAYEMLRMNFPENIIDGNEPYFFEDYNKVWKPRDKGPIGRFEMNYNSPVGGRENYVK